MLQQTRIAVVIPAYRRFLRSFPTVHHLARADEDRVLAQWSGLGYYSRARALHRAARQLVAEADGHFPRTMEALRALPGIGPYVGAAVLSIAFDKPHAALDGNVVRVLSRLACLPRPDARGAPHQALADLLLAPRRPGDWNQALMELGETICVPKAPRCSECPVRRDCGACASGATAAYPPPRPRRATERVRLELTVLRDRAGRLLLQRGEFAYLSHLWLPPLHVAAAEALADQRRCGSFTHSILHRQFQVNVFEQIVSPQQLAAQATGGPGTVERRVFSATQLRRIGRSSLLSKALKLITPVKSNR